MPPPPNHVFIILWPHPLKNLKVPPPYSCRPIWYFFVYIIMSRRGQDSLFPPLCDPRQLQNPSFSTLGHASRTVGWPVSCTRPLAPQTENSAPPWRARVIRRRRRRRPVKGLNHSREGGPPNTALIPSQRTRRSQVGFSFFKRSISCDTHTHTLYQRF